MVETFFEGLSEGPHLINRYQTKRLAKDKYLITADHGSWAVLTKREYDLLRLGRITEDPNLMLTLRGIGVMVHEDDMDGLAEQYRSRFAHLDRGVVLHIVVPTLRCNFTCVYCHAKSRPMDTTGVDMDEETARATVDFIMQSPGRDLTLEFQGGEPLAAFDMVHYITEYAKDQAHLKKKRMTFLMVTNLSLMTDDKLDYLASNRFGLCTSLDGPEEVHDANRRYFGGAGSYENVTYWINRIRNIKHVGLSALPTISKHSLSYGKEIVDEYVKWGFPNIRIRQLNDAGFAAERWKEVGYSADEFMRFYKDTLEYIIDLNRQGVRMHENMATIVLRKILCLKASTYTCFGSPCGAALNQVAYTQDGDIYACDESRSFDIFRIGNVRDDTYKGVFTSPQVQHLVGLTSHVCTMCDTCIWHPYCGSCAVCTYGSQGNLVSKLPMDKECAIRGGLVEHLFHKIIVDPKDRSILLEWARTLD